MAGEANSKGEAGEEIKGAGEDSSKEEAGVASNNKVEDGEVNNKVVGDSQAAGEASNSKVEDGEANSKAEVGAVSSRAAGENNRISVLNLLAFSETLEGCRHGETISRETTGLKISNSSKSST